MLNHFILPGLSAAIPVAYHFYAPKVEQPHGILLPVGYGYVIACVVSSLWLTSFMSVKAGSARKQAKIPYPYMYAEKAEAEKNPHAHLFNCAQRVHYHTLENLNSFVLLSLFNGLFFPRATAALSFLWVVSRVAFTVGYMTGKPNNRILGSAVGSLSLLSLLLVATYSVFTVVG